MTDITRLTLTVSGQDEVFEFTDAEVPEKINFGGAQTLITQKMVGGLRVIDAMGADDAAIAWSGIFFGADAIDRSQYLDQVRRSGAVCTLQWDNFQYAVIVSDFKAEFNKRFWISYSMSCQVVQDKVAAIPVTEEQSPGDALNEDCATATQLCDQIGSPSISAAVEAVGDAVTDVTTAAQPIANGLVSLSAPQIGPQVGQVSTLSVAASAAILTAGAPLAALQGSVRGAISNCEQAVAALPTLGYIDPTQPMAGQVTALVAQCGAATLLPSLYELSATTTRMQDNLALMADPAGINQIVTGGGNLYQLAAQVYGDATRWTDIAQASDIDDPMMTGFNTVTVPQ